jgi:hypothetical protein
MRKHCLLFLFPWILSACSAPATFTKIVDMPKEEKKAETFTVRIDTGEHGQATASPSRETYEKGTQIRLKADPASGYVFSSWSGTITANDNPLILTMAKNEWIIPVFTKVPEQPGPPAPAAIPSYTVRIDQAPGGSVRISPEKESYQNGDQVLVTATDDPEYEFEYWNGTVTGTSREIFLTITGNQWLIPHFRHVAVNTTYALDTSIIGEGSVTRMPDKTAYSTNEKVHITAKADAASMLIEWSGSASGKSTECDIVMDGDKTVTANFKNREWTFIVYMAADNDLERSAILDFCEMESFARAGAPVTVLVLFDRGPGYDATNGDWTDTRLFEILPDENDNDVVIDSPAIPCPPLGILPGETTELDMSEPRVLSYLLDFAKSSYRANHYGLIIWGHGTGWRSVRDFSAQYRAERSVALDDTSSSWMCITELAPALDGKKIDVIGFDTCFGAILETAYELRAKADYFVGSEGSVPSTGWNYSELFTQFCSGNRSSLAFCQSAKEQYAKQYGGEENATISTIRLSGIPELVSAFDGFAGMAAACITTKETASAVRTTVLNECLIYRSATYPCDGFIDIDSFRTKMTAMMPSVASASTRLAAAIDGAITDSWSGDKTAGKKIGVHLIPFIAANTPQATHSTGYIKGSGDAQQSAFVRESTGWVPNRIPANSFLDKIFYVSF